MSLWNKTGTKPQNLTRVEKRNVIATDRGWIRRLRYTDTHGNVRTKDEILVSLEGLANSSNMGTPSISDMVHSSSAIANGESITTTIYFDEPVANGNIEGSFQLTVANTAAGSSGGIAVANTVITGANNILSFIWTPDGAGTYKIEAQTITNATATAVSLKSTNAGGENASLIVSGTVSNTAGSVVVSDE